MRKRRKVENVLFKEKLYKFLVDNENKQLILTLINLILFVFYLKFLENPIVALIIYFFVSYLLNKKYESIIRHFFGKTLVNRFSFNKSSDSE